MRKLLLLLIPCMAFGATDSINYNTADGKLKVGSSGVGASVKPFNAFDVWFTHLAHHATFYVDGSSNLLTAGIKNPVKVPEDCFGTLLGWTMMCKPSGSVTVDILRSADNAGLPVTSIVGAGTKPFISSNVENASASFTSWTSTTINAKDNLAIRLSGITNASYVELTLFFR